MIKPEDIPEAIWAGTKKTFDELYERETSLEGGCEFGIREAIARAIMAAKAEERDACAKLIEDNMLVGDDYVFEEQLMPRGRSGNKVGYAYAAAIRNRDTV